MPREAQRDPGAHAQLVPAPAEAEGLLALGQLIVERLLESHGRLEHRAVEPVERDQADQLVPVEEVVVDASVEVAEHAPEPVLDAAHLPPRYAQQLAIASVDRAVEVRGEAEGQRRCDIAVALEDVRVVPDPDVGLTGGRGGRREAAGHGAALEDHQALLCDRPFDVLGGAEERLDAGGGGVQRPDLLRLQRR